MPYEQLKLKHQVCHRLYIASNGLTRLYRPFLKPLGLTYPQYVIMMALWEKDDVTMGALAKTTCVDKGFLATTIEKLDSMGLLKIRVDENDKRKKFLILTAKGRKLEERVKDIPMKIVTLLGGDEGDREAIEALIRMLDKINASLSQTLD